MDDELVTVNHRLTSKGIAAIPEILTSPYYTDNSGYSYEYRPIVHVSFAIEHEFFGDNPHISHLINVLLYSLSCVLLFMVLCRLFQNYSPLLSLAISLVFVAHPSHTEVVCSIKNRDEILSLFFGLLAFLSSLKFLQNKNRWMLLGVCVFFPLALLSKITSVLFAVIILLSVVAFLSASFWELFILTIMLLGPSIYFQTSLNGYTKFILLTAGVLSLCLFYLYRNVNLVAGAISKTSKIVVSGINYQSSVLTSSHNEEISFFKSTIPSFTEFSVQKGFMVFTPLFVFWTGHFFQLVPLKIIGLMGVLLLLFNKDEMIAWIAYCAFNIVLLLSFSSMYYYFRGFCLEIFCIPLSYNMVFGNRKLFIPSILTLVFLLLLSLVVYTEDIPIVFAPLTFLLCFFVMRYKYGWGLSLFFFPIIIISSIYSQSMHHVALGYNLLSQIPFVLFFVMTIVLYFKLRVNAIFKGYILIAGVLCVALRENEVRLPYHYVNMVNSINSLNPEILNNKQNRPIHYVEECIDYGRTSISERIGTSLEVLFHYAHKVVLPYPLSFYYGYSFIKPMRFTDTIPLLSMFIHIVVLGLGLYFIRRNAIISFGLFLYLISIFLYSNFLQGVPGMLADRFLIIPSLGWIIALVAIFQMVFKIDLMDKKASFNKVSVAAKYLFVLCLIIYSSLTFARNIDWKDDLTLFRKDIKYVDNSAQGHNLLALHLMKASDSVVNLQEQAAIRYEALSHFQMAVKIYPPFFNPTYDIARVYTLLNKPDSAIIYFRKTVALDSTFSNAYLSLGELLFQQKRYSEASASFEKLTSLTPEDFTGYANGIYICTYQKDYDKAAEIGKIAVKRMPKNPIPYVAVSRIYHTMNKDDSTQYWLRKALEVDPSNKEAKDLLQTFGK